MLSQSMSFTTNKHTIAGTIENSGGLGSAEAKEEPPWMHLKAYICNNGASFFICTA